MVLKRWYVAGAENVAVAIAAVLVISCAVHNTANAISIKMLVVLNQQSGTNRFEPGTFVKAVVPIRLTDPRTGKSVTVQADLDTGADHSYMTAKVRESLGLAFENEPAARAFGVGGSFAASVVTADLEILGDGRASVRKMPASHFYVNAEQPPPPYDVILGVVGFVDQFREVSLSYPDQRLILRW